MSLRQELADLSRCYPVKHLRHKKGQRMKSGQWWRRPSPEQWVRQCQARAEQRARAQEKML